jgi:hypothetical protein
MKKALEVLKRELRHVEYLLDPKTGWVVAEADPGTREARIAMKEHDDPTLWKEAFWPEDLDGKIRPGVIVSGNWRDDDVFEIEEAYTQDELLQLKNDLEEAIFDLETPRFIEVRTTDGQTLSPVIVRDLKEAVLNIHDELDEDYITGDSARIYNEYGDLVYEYTPALELAIREKAEYLSEDGLIVIKEDDVGDIFRHPKTGRPFTKIFPV